MIGQQKCVGKERDIFLSSHVESHPITSISVLSLFLAENPRPQENEVDEEQTFNDRNEKLLQGTGTAQIEAPLAKLQAAILHPVRPLFTLF